MRTCPSCRGLVAEAAIANCPHCSAQLPTMRFRLNPASAAADPHPGPAPAPPVASAAAPMRGAMTGVGAGGGSGAASHASGTPPSAALPFDAPTFADRLRALVDNRRLMVVAVIVLLVVFGSGTAAYLELSPTARYPERYLVAEDEMPRGLSNVQLPQELYAQMGLESNPGALSDSMLSRVASGSHVQPEEGWMQMLGREPMEIDVFVIALRFDSASAAEDWLADSTERCDDADGEIFRHGSVVVTAFAEDSDSMGDLARVLDLLQDKSPRLEPYC